MRRSRKKQRRLGPGSWWVPGQNTLKIARVRHPVGEYVQYAEGLYIPVARQTIRPPTIITATGTTNYVLGVIW